MRSQKSKSKSQVIGVILLVVGLVVGTAVGFLAAPSVSFQEPTTPVVAPQEPDEKAMMAEKIRGPIP